MKKSVKKIIRRIHLWLGLASGIVVFIMAITGAIYVFSYEIKSVLHKDYELVEVPKNPKKIARDDNKWSFGWFTLYTTM